MINSLKFRAVLVVMVCLVFLTEGVSQNFSQHNWYFGSGTQGIRFDRTTNTATLVNNKATPFGTGGSAVATDSINGDLLFYTDGVRVYNRIHLLMPGGLLTGNPSANQPVVICPIPGQTTQYYVFTMDATGSIFRSVVDLSLVGNEPAPTPPLGNVVAASINTATGLTGRSEAMIIVPHSNKTDYWLITHTANSDSYSATLINSAGLFPTTISTPVTTLPVTAANFSYHAASGMLALSPKSADDDVAILNFDNTSGAISLNQFVPNSAVSSTIGQSIYDTEWSNSGRYLYISRHGEAGIPADILQFDVLNPITSLATVLDFVPDRSYGLQMAPDSAIYYLYQATAGGPFLVGQLTETDTAAIAVVDSASYFGPGINFNATQFPSFTPGGRFNFTVSFTTAGACGNSPISFYPVVAPAADSLLWDFGDSQSSSEWSPIHTYQGGGSFNVSVTAFLNGQAAIGNATINLTNFDVQLTLVQDTTACECELPVNNNIPPCPNDTSDDFAVDVTANGGSGNFTYIWSNGDAGKTLTPDSAGYYYVVVTDASTPGCTAYAGVNVREYDAIDQRANVWYFGQNAGINFNQPVTTVSGPLNTPEGTSVISDRNGFVIFSTDGFRVYDRNDNEVTTDATGAPIPFPPGIGGENDATQSALIMPVPGDETLYYIFTTKQIQGSYSYELRYSLYDIKLNNGDGGLAQYNQLLFKRSTERLTGDANWLIAHEYGNNSFRAYPITPQGIGNPVISSIGSDHLISEEMNGQGYMKLGGPGQLVVALATQGVSNFLEFFDFDNATGEITNFRSVNLNSATGQVYGIEFSGSKVFATLRGVPNSFLRELYFDFQGNPVLIPPAAASGPIAAELGAIQIGPDGSIYVAENDQAFLGTISVNGDTLQLSNYNLHAFPLAAGTQSQLGLPNFIQNVGTAPSGPSILIEGFCLGDSTVFTGGGTDPIDEFEWFFGDGFGANTQIARHMYAAAGTYNVSLRITNRCGLDTLLMQTITIVAPPAPPTFLPPGQLAVLCNGPVTLEAEPSPGTAGYTYAWPDGSTNRTFVVSRQSIVSVTITNAQGCTSAGNITVVDNRPQVELGPDQTICQNAFVSPLDAQNPGTQFQWFVADVANGNITQTQGVSTALPTMPTGTEYKVQVTDPITMCVAKDSVVFIINASPTFNAVTTNTSGCGNADGQIALTILGPANTLFSYLVVGTVTGTTLQGIDKPVGAVMPVFSPLAGDTYIVQVTDQISSCATTTSAVINDNSFTITSVVRQNPCNPVNLVVTHTYGGSFNWNVIDNATNLIVASSPAPITGSPFTITGINSGTYRVQITSADLVGTQCSFTTPAQAFNQNPTVPVAFDITDICNDNVTASGGTTYDWSQSEAGSIAATNGATVTLNPGTWDLVVIVGDGGVNCPGTGTITVTVENVTADFTQSDQCADIVTLSATPTGSFTYLWRNITAVGPAGPQIVSGSQLDITPAENGNLFEVTVRSVLTGCTYTAQKTVFAVGELAVSFTNSTAVPCPGVPFTLTATPTLSGAPLVGAVDFQWQFEGDVVGSNSSTHSDTEEGNYEVTASFSGCNATAGPLFVAIADPTPGSLPDLAIICDNSANPECALGTPEPNSCVLILDPDINGKYGFTNHSWIPGGETTSTLRVTAPGTYIVQMDNMLGCPTTDQTIVERECNPRIVAPTAFRPGSSIGKNNEFSVLTFFIDSDDFQIFIFNRWGEMVYQANGLEENAELTLQSRGWNGGYNNNRGELLPAGTYSYIVKYRSLYHPEEGMKEKRGGVVLLR